MNDRREGTLSVGSATRVATPATANRVSVEVEFQGLVDLVSDQSDQPAPCCVLMPNAKEPNASWIPKALRFDTPHAARLVVRDGNWCWQGPGSLEVTGFPADECLPAFSLDGLAFGVVGETGLSADRNAAPDCALQMCNEPPDPDSTLNILGAMDMLVRRMNQDWHALFLGGVEPKLIQGKISPHRARITSRMLINGGHLCTSRVWGEDKARPFLFHVHPPKRKLIQTYSAFLGQSMMLHLTVEDAVTLEFKRLETDELVGYLQVHPNSEGKIRMAVKNLDKDAYEDGLHFLAHYMIRKRWRWICHARYPDTSNWVDSSGLDPQCTPGDLKG